jgi:hypothetical protein
LFVAALAAVCGFAAVAASAHDAIKVESSVTIKFQQGGPYSPYAEDTFVGKVKGKKGCKKGRTVKVIKQGGGVEGTANTNRNGFYDVQAKSSKGNFFAKVKKETHTKHGDKIKCSKAASNTISVP